MKNKKSAMILLIVQNRLKDKNEHHRLREKISNYANDIHFNPSYKCWHCQKNCIEKYDGTIVYNLGVNNRLAPYPEKTDALFFFQFICQEMGQSVNHVSI